MGEVMQVFPLALSEAGDPLDLPEATTSWRIKYFKNGSRRPELLRERNGMPIHIPVSANPDELIHAVGGIRGRFRLEPINEYGRLVDKEICAVIVLGESPDMAASHDADASGDSRDRMVADVIRSQNELVATLAAQQQQLVTSLATQQQLFMTEMAKHFGSYIDSTSKLLNGPTPTAPNTPSKPRNAFDALNEFKKMKDYVQENFTPDEDDDDESPLEKIAEQAMPLLMQAMPLLQYWVHRGMGLSADQSRGLLGIDATDAPENTDNTSAQEDDDQQERVIDADKITAIVAHLTPDESSRFEALFGDSEFRTIAHDVHLLPTQDAVAQAKLLIAQHAIEQHLTPKEQKQCRAMLANLPPQQVEQLQQQLLTLSTEAAVAKIRMVLPKV